MNEKRKIIIKNYGDFSKEKNSWQYFIWRGTADATSRTKSYEQGITVLLVEQNARMALSIADRAYVLETGRITMTGTERELLKDEKIKKHTLEHKIDALY